MTRGARQPPRLLEAIGQGEDARRLRRAQRRLGAQERNPLRKGIGHKGLTQPVSTAETSWHDGLHMQARNALIARKYIRGYGEGNL